MPKPNPREEEALEAMISEGGPITDSSVSPEDAPDGTEGFNPSPNYQEVMQALQAQIADLTLQLTVARLTLAKMAEELRRKHEQ